MNQIKKIREVKELLKNIPCDSIEELNDINCARRMLDTLVERLA